MEKYLRPKIIALVSFVVLTIAVIAGIVINIKTLV